MQYLPVAAIERHLEALLDLIERLVRHETPTEDKAAIDQLAKFIRGEAEAHGGQVKRFEQSTAGDHIAAVWNPGRGGVLLLTHMDTVHPLGTLARMPLRREGRRLFGPGVVDMKASIAMALTAIGVLREEGALPGHQITLLCTSDEETGSLTSRSLIEEMASEHSMVLCLEAALPDGSLKTRRKGIGNFEIEAIGRPAHAAVGAELGVNAILELTHQIDRLRTLVDGSDGTTINVGTIAGGTKSNVVPERCSMRLDVRIPSQSAARRVEDSLHSLEPVLEGARLQVSGGWNRPPMPRTEAILAAYRQAEVVASALGLEIGHGSTGGASDANFVAPLDQPLLDGLGAVGGGAHSLEEYIWIDSLAARTALLAGLITEPQ